MSNKLILPLELVNNILNYLGEKPAKEVIALINGIHGQSTVYIEPVEVPTQAPATAPAELETTNP